MRAVGLRAEGASRLTGQTGVLTIASVPALWGAHATDPRRNRRRPGAATRARSESEERLRELLASSPDLMPGELVDSQRPRRWLLVTREAGIALPGESGGSRWLRGGLGRSRLGFTVKRRITSASGVAPPDPRAEAAPATGRHVGPVSRERRGCPSDPRAEHVARHEQAGPVRSPDVGYG